MNDGFTDNPKNPSVAPGRLADCLSPASFWKPAHLVESAWLEHAPFAFWLIDAIRPHRLVELGTHRGFSYFCFCQAVQRLGLDTACHAVDTWKGDDHAGFYGEEIWTSLSAENDRLYHEFSTLMRASFAEAQPYFADGSIDLLHIDGRHGFDDVAADFESWRPKLSDRAVVLFHDTNVREREFGVWRLWQDLVPKHPSFEFIHGHGLGVLAPGPVIPDGLRPLLLATPDERAEIQAAYARLGAAVSTQWAVDVARTHIAEATRQNATLDAEIQAQAEEIAKLRDETATQLSRIDDLNRQLGQMKTEVAEAIAAKAKLTQQMTSLRKDSIQSRLEKARLLAEITAEREAAEILRDQNRQLSAAIAGAMQAVALIEQSTIWRATAPLRRLLDRHPGLHKTVRRSTRLALWTVTGQLPGRITARRLAAQAAPPALAADMASDAALKQAMRAGLATQLRAFLAGGSRLNLPTSSRPEVSIILILYNQAELTFGCLNSIKACLTGKEPRFEVIILDNGSSDDTAALLDRVEGAQIIRSPENLHFLKGVNRAVESAGGSQLLLLNNDAQLLPGSLEAALETLTADPAIGAVGGRLILPDGRLQEAGSIVWQDGTCTGYARGLPPDAPVAMFRREVDYCSGAFLLTPRELFLRLGSFDEAYAPAYYEETDYCLKLHEHGFKVVYDPDAVVLHFEFGSAAESGLELQRRNHQIFRDRHQPWLAGQLPFRPENLLAARQTRRDERRRVLMIEDRVPHIDLGSGYPRANDLLRAVAENAQVTFFPMFPNDDDWPAVRRSVPRDVEVMLGETVFGLPQFLAERRGQFDTIIVSRPHNMRQFRNAVDADPSLTGSARIIYDAEALFGHREAQKQALEGNPMPAGEIEALVTDEIALASTADAVISISAKDAALFREYGVSNVHILGHALSIDPTPNDFSIREGIIFVGGVHSDDSPNADSLRWFAAEVLPLLRVKLDQPDLRLKVVGFNRAESVAELDGTALDLLGRVADLRDPINAARILVAPTRFAAGLPHKIGQAAALGIPVVATDLLAEQLGWQNGRDLLAASDAEGFAEACATLYQNEALWRRLRQSALERCQEESTPEQFRATVAEILGGGSAPAPSWPRGPAGYADWIRAYDTLTLADRRAIKEQVVRFSYRPLISVIVPTFNTPEKWLRRCIDSVLDQLYDNWELCIADDSSPEPHVAAICREYAARDHRIRFVQCPQRGHIAAASNAALALATGEFVALLDHDDELADHALYMVAEALQHDRDLDLIFTDEDKIDETGLRREPWFKPRWDPDVMLSQNAVVHLAVYRRSLLTEIGGFRSGFDGSQDYDLTLRFSEKTTPSRIRRIPFVLYHWRMIPGSVALAADQKDYPYEAGLRAIREHLERRGTGGTVTREAHLGYYRAHWPLPDPAPRVTLIIPTRNKVELLRLAISSILERTDYPDYEILVVDNNSDEAETLAYLAEIGTHARIRVVRDEHPYSFAALNNRAVGETTSPLIAFVNNDIEVMAPDWLREMASQAMRPEVGAVGAKLYYPNGTIQHAGVVVGIGGLAGHPHLAQPGDTLGYFGRAAVIQRFSAVTAACLVMRREVFLELEGFDAEHFAIAFNDVDLGLRLNRAGYAVIWTPYAELIHHESASLGPPESEARRAQFTRECDNLRRIWADVVADDPYYNPNLTITGGDFLPAFPPRAERPYRRLRLA